MAKKKQETIVQTLTHGHVYFGGKNYQFNFNTSNQFQFDVEILEMQNVPKETEVIENRQILQQVTTWRAIDEKEAEKVQKSIEMNMPVIDKKINGVDVESVVIEKTIVEPTKVIKMTDNFTAVPIVTIPTYVQLSTAAVRIFVLNYLKTL